MINKEKLSTYIEWDILIWSKSLVYWDNIMKETGAKMEEGLEVGSRNGGLTLFFVDNYNSKVVCSDYGYPSEEAKVLHKFHNVESNVNYADVDCTTIPYKDNTFDFVVFKSVLGAVGRQYGEEGLVASISEMRRVLKPGGVLFFAENLSGSYIHKFARKNFVKWGNTWDYMDIPRLSKLFKNYSNFELKSTGFLSSFVPNRWRFIRDFAGAIDNTLGFLIPAKWRYVGYGYAIK